MSETAITLTSGAKIYARMTWLRMKRGRIVWAAALLLALPVVYVAALAIAGHWGRGLFDDVCELYFRFLIPFVPALTASGAVAEEIENKTFTFVFARPAPRGSLVLGKLVATTLPALAVIVPSLLVSWLIAHLRFPGDMADTWPHLLRVEFAAVAGLMTFAALAMVIGTVFSRHPIVTVLIYLLLIEAGLGSAPIVINLVAISWHLRNLAELPLPETAFMAFSVPWWASAIVPLVLTPLLTFLATVAVNGAEYRTDR
ncbi:MAG: ABC-type transport system involved in multi-copper enzyme maturation, permease component [Myxococcales bacterium]|nr:ABC-type transport system involved in multi-copper enzyme maturation, permease component [Myxococcales bacterium]